MRNSKIYIAGKISGDPGYRTKFRLAEDYLQECHDYEMHDIVNPVEWCGENWSWLRCMALCLWLVADCAAVAMLPDWKQSRGARIEHRWAELLGKKMLYLPDVTASGEDKSKNTKNSITMDNNEEKTMVEMTPEEKAQFDAFQQEQARKAQAEAKREQRKQLQEMTDEVMADAVEQLVDCHLNLVETKKRVIETFSTLMELRKEVNEEAGKKEQDTFMFTNSEGTQRIRIGYNMNDNYLDQVEEGIAKVKAYLESLAKDEQSKELISLVLRLLARDQKGNLKASRVIQLGQLAEKSGNEDFQEGMRIIREAYRPIRSKLFIRCSIKEPEKEWQDIGLGMGEV